MTSLEDDFEDAFVDLNETFVRLNEVGATWHIHGSDARKRIHYNSR